MFRTSSLISQQLKRSSSVLVRPGALLCAGSLAYLAHSESQQEQQENDTPFKKNNRFEGLTASFSAITAVPTILQPLQPTLTLCDQESKQNIRQVRDKQTAIIRDLLLENPNLEPKKYRQGHVLHKEGETSRGLCIVLDGEISLSTGRLSVSRKHKGDIFGALSLVTEGYGPRRFTARCISKECTIVEIGQEEFDEAIAAHPELKKGLRDICLCQEFQRLVVLHKQKHFPKTPDAIRSLFHSIRYSPGTELQLLDVERVVRSMDRKKPKKDIEAIFAAMDVDGNGGLSEEEFEVLFYEM